MLIAAAILHGYIGIRFGRKCICIAGFCGFVHLYTFVAYCGVFQKAHGQIEMQEQVKQELRAVCGKCRRPLVRAELRKAVRALDCKGMRVGSFHDMERNSALVFIDYVERQLLGLLVTF